MESKIITTPKGMLKDLFKGSSNILIFGTPGSGKSFSHIFNPFEEIKKNTLYTATINEDGTLEYKAVGFKNKEIK